MAQRRLIDKIYSQSRRRTQNGKKNFKKRMKSYNLLKSTRRWETVKVNCLWFMPVDKKKMLYTIMGKCRLCSLSCMGKAGLMSHMTGMTMWCLPNAAEASLSEFCVQNKKYPLFPRNQNPRNFYWEIKAGIVALLLVYCLYTFNLKKKAWSLFSLLWKTIAK